MVGKINCFGNYVKQVLPLTEIENLKEHRRFRVYYHKGIKCVSCGIEATHIEVGVASNMGLHTDLMAGNKGMTIDHIIPKSKGGSSDLENLQPMCRECNKKKGSN